MLHNARCFLFSLFLLFASVIKPFLLLVQKKRLESVLISFRKEGLYRKNTTK